MLTDVRLLNFRGFHDHVLPLRPTTVVVGANNAGKTTVIEALRLISTVVARHGALNFHDVPSWLSAPRIFRGVSPSLRGIDFNSLSIFHKLRDPPALIKAAFHNGVSVDVYIGPEAALYAVIHDADGKIVSSKSRANAVRIPQISILPQVSPLAKEEVILGRDYVRRITSSNWASLHFRNQLSLYPELFDDFRELAESTWPGLRVLQLEGGSGVLRDQLALFIQDDDFVAEVAWMGHGLQMWLQIMWFLARSRNSTTIILDEPDVYMHADLQRKLMRLLLNRHDQVITATHSVEIMAEVEASNVLLVNRSTNESVFADSIPQVQRIIDSVGGVHNLQLARLWNSRRCLSVEGKDITLLRQVQNVLYPDTVQPLGILPNIQLGGWSGWSYAVGSRLLLKNSFGDDVLLYCIFDSDYHTPEEIAERYQQARARGVQLHIWKKKEIENYFLISDAIRRIIAKEQRTNGPEPSLEDIILVIDGAAEEEKEVLFDAMATELYSRDKGQGIAVANKGARKRVEEGWESREARWSMVSGKTLITKLSAWSQSHYQVSLSPMRISREVRRNELDPELRMVIAAIEKGVPFDDGRR